MSSSRRDRYAQFVAASAVIAALIGASTAGLRVEAAGPPAGAHSQGQQALGDTSLTPEQRMNARFPQNVRTGDLLGLPIQDYDDRILGYVTDVVRGNDGKISLIMPEGGWFGRGGRPVAIPIEAVAILGKHINLLDIPRDEVSTLPTWHAAESNPVDRNEIIRIAIGRR